ncbi:response regulator transcription factor [Acidimangrovimonas sediminis]|uniref:response regulator transcription factor n=1 Tax=Acidimangrovimonas sediminis TaxID=2056283 RepID=UPI000C80C205|nr:response regulator transcription factor [Acidimangrovimonas sediminis]
MRVLIVEDAADMAEAVRGHLHRAGMTCDVAGTVAAAEDHLAVTTYDALVLDIHLPDRTGTELLRDLRARGLRVPVLMLTALFSVDDRVSALDHGADDYLVKPFDHRELEARLRALIRRNAAQKGEELKLGRLSWNPATLGARVDDERIDLTRRETVLLGLLIRNAGRTMSKERLYEGLFSFSDTDVGLNAIELYIARLRKKLAGSGVAIETRRGLGYRMDTDG